jgi:hypothetical protein
VVTGNAAERATKADQESLHRRVVSFC